MHTGDFKLLRGFFHRDKLFRIKKGKAADELNNIVKTLDWKIENLETDLRNLQETEIQCRDKVMTTFQVTDEENICHCVEGGDIENDLVLNKNILDKTTPNNLNNPDDYPLDVLALQDPARALSGRICVDLNTWTLTCAGWNLWMIYVTIYLAKSTNASVIDLEFWIDCALVSDTALLEKGSHTASQFW
jgi:hypothetical protein